MSLELTVAIERRRRERRRLCSCSSHQTSACTAAAPQETRRTTQTKGEHWSGARGLQQSFRGKAGRQASVNEQGVMKPGQEASRLLCLFSISFPHCTLCMPLSSEKEKWQVVSGFFGPWLLRQCTCGLVKNVLPNCDAYSHVSVIS